MYRDFYGANQYHPDTDARGVVKQQQQKKKVCVSDAVIKYISTIYIIKQSRAPRTLIHKVVK